MSLDYFFPFIANVHIYLIFIADNITILGTMEIFHILDNDISILHAWLLCLLLLGCKLLDFTNSHISCFCNGVLRTNKCCMAPSI